MQHNTLSHRIVLVVGFLWLSQICQRLPGFGLLCLSLVLLRMCAYRVRIFSTRRFASKEFQPGLLSETLVKRLTRGQSLTRVTTDRRKSEGFFAEATNSHTSD